MSKIAKRSAASRKTWRTRKRMKHARLPMGIPLVIKHLWGNDKIILVKSKWPSYMKRALPLPDFGDDR